MTESPVQELRRRDAILDAARSATERFLDGDGDWRAHLHEILGAFGRAAEVSRVFVADHLVDEQGRLCSRSIGEWDAPGVPVAGDDPELQALPYEPDFARWEQVLGRGDMIAGSVRDFPPVERALFEPQGVISCVVVPVFVDGEWWGHVGFDECTRERTWSAAEQAALRTAAAIIGLAVRLERTRAALRAEETERAQTMRLLERRVSALARVAAALVVDQPLEVTIGDVVRILVESGAGVAAALHVVDQATGEIALLATHGLPEGYADALRAAWALGADVPATPASRDQPMQLVRDAPAQRLADPLAAPIHPYMGTAPWYSVLSLPLDSLGRHQGALHVYRPPGPDPEPEEIAFLSAVADQTAVAVENARLLADGRRNAALLERQRLARDLHDSVSQALFSMTLHARTAQLAMAKLGLPDDGPLGRTVGQLRELTQGALAEMRALIFELRPGALAEEGLLAAVTKQAAALGAREGLPITVTGPAERPQLPADVEEHLYRIVLEALHNVVKHARAGKAAVTVTADHDGLQILVEDDGAGFDPTVDHPGHLGLGTMRDRAAAIGAELVLDSAPGRGTRVGIGLAGGRP
ncbi:GAF domain-containing sensor histidine kinase [Geodermatophilus ruber]|uniref:Histidine kinase-, DNA gyrase B-, and HSP90-like ATPase n=1 Tax=Geodermatophilus ruber TaxID=504800 RepID=A0A1I4DEP5_9ACTN|nr:GAF domain-containing sensor histidine kinase [Geodermatophilus ruber]SFK91605.1 Histidine kinase-, DNA gyrase B-, and HSP90-like ATPase [Geodermatophilus ruber]